VLLEAAEVDVPARAGLCDGLHYLGEG
jgi:hypothetical protein